MKKLYSLILLVLISHAVSAQISKGSTLMGGQLYYYTGDAQFNNQDHKINSALVDVSAGKAFKENQVAGIHASYSPYRQQNYFNGLDTIDVNRNRYAFGVFYRMYRKLAKDFYFFGQADAAYYYGMQREHYRISDGDVKTTTQGGVLSFTPGLSYRVWRRLHLEVTLPGIFSCQYEASKVNSQVPQIVGGKVNQFQVISALNANSLFINLGIGFVVVL